MKKFKFVLGLMLAFGLALTSCNQPTTPSDKALTAEDLNDASWLLGTWNTTAELKQTVTLEGEFTDAEKEILENLGLEEYSDKSKNTNEVTNENLEQIKTYFKQTIEQVQKANGSITISSDKKVITMVIEEKKDLSGSDFGMSAEKKIKLSYYTKSVITKVE